jgi:hypothetical protein
MDEIQTKNVTPNVLGLLSSKIAHLSGNSQVRGILSFVMISGNLNTDLT